MRSPLPPEPAALRAELRVAVAEAPARAHELVTEALCAHLGSTWPDTDGEAGLLRGVVEGARYETYLWVMGDRRWSQLADTLAGRLRRRGGRGEGSRRP